MRNAVWAEGPVISVHWSSEDWYVPPGVCKKEPWVSTAVSRGGVWKWAEERGGEQMERRLPNKSYFLRHAQTVFETLP